MHGLRNFVRGHQESKRFINSLNARWRSIYKDIDEYNELIQKLPTEERPRPLDPKSVKEHGLLLDSFWDINRLEIQHEWARSEIVRTAMDNLLKVRRAKEEQAIITLEVQRVLQWLEVEIHAYNYAQDWIRPWIIVRFQHLERMVSGFCRERRKLTLDISEVTKRRFLGM